MAAFFSDPINDFGYNYRWELGRAYTDRQLFLLGYKVTARLYQSFPTEELYSELQNLVADGFDVAFITSSVYVDEQNKFTADYPNFKIIALAGTSRPSVAKLDPKSWEGYFLAGIACGTVTQSNTVAFLGVGVQSLSWSYENAFYLGVRSVNSDARVLSTFTDSFYDPLLEDGVARILVEDYDVDCASSQSVDAAKAWTNMSIPSVGQISDQRYLVGELSLFSSLYNWGSPLFEIVNTIPNGNWSVFSNKTTWSGFDTGLMALGDFSTQTPENVRRAVDDAYTSLVARPNSAMCGTFPGITPALYNNTCLSVSQILSFKTPLPGLTLIRNYTRADIIEDLFVDYSSPLGIALIVVVSVLLLLGLLVFIDVQVKQRNLVFRASSPVFLSILILGCSMAFISVFFWMGVPTQTWCNMRIWLGGLGFSITYSALIMKNYRIWRLFSKSSLKVFKITNIELILKGVLPMTLIESAILIAWTVADPYQPVINTSSTFLTATQEYLTCQSQGVWPVALFLCTKGVLLICGVLVSYKIKNVKKKLYNESKSIGWAIYNTVFIGVVAIAILLIIPYNVGIEAGIVGFAIMLIGGSVLFFLFFPKLRRVHFGNGEDSSDTSLEKSSTNKASVVLTGQLSSNSSKPETMGDTHA
jgi:basic membrane lipoprotein Med (substrate-binding protein (PBP1-ABC) superfamily)